MSLFSNSYFYLFCISMLPIIELRGSIPIGAAVMELPFWNVYIVCVLGNLLPVPFLILFSKKVLEWLAKKNIFSGFFNKIMHKADEKAATLGKYELFGLWLLVAIPLPGTGAWTGSLVSAVTRMRFIPSCIVIALGVMTSGLIMAGLFYLLPDIFSVLFG